MKKKRLFSIVLSLCMVLALMPQMVFAEDISGEHNEDVTVNNGDTISGGTFNGKVMNHGTINDGTFYGWTLNLGEGQIRGGTFCGTVDNADVDCMIYDGTFKGTVNNVIGSIYGGTFKGTVNNDMGRIYGGTFYETLNASEETLIYGGIFYGGISSNCNIDSSSCSVTFMNGDSDYAIEVVKNSNKAAVPIEPDAPEGKKFAGWYTDETLITSYDFDSDVIKNITLYARFDPIISITVPFTTKVELGGNVQPGETVFNMQVLDYSGDKYLSSDVEIEAKPVTTNGAGSYNGEITFTGTEAEIFNMFRHNGFVFVKQEDVDYTNWKIDDTVWCLFHSGAAELSEGEAEAEPSPIIILPAINEYDGDVMYYDPVFPEDDEIQPYKMTFINTYTESEAGPSDSDDTNGDADNDSKADAEDSAKTGDDTNIAMWLALLLLSGAGITGTAVYTIRKRTNE